MLTKYKWTRITRNSKGRESSFTFVEKRRKSRLYKAEGKKINIYNSTLPDQGCSVTAGSDRFDVCPTPK